MQNHSLTAKQDTVRAMCLLTNAPEFKLFLAGLRAQREQIRDAIEAHRDTDFQNELRGQSIAISEILGIVDNSQTTLARLMASGKR